MIGVIFDMDGTLLDTQRIYIDAWEAIGPEYGVEGLGSHIPAVCGMNVAAWQQYLRERFPSIVLDEFYEKVKDYIQKNLVIRFMPGAKELMTFLKEHHVPMAIASGSSRNLITYYFSHLGGLDDFAAVVGGDEVRNSKPAPDIFLQAADRLGISPENCIVFEDAENGVQAAFAAGMRCIAVPDVAPISEATCRQLFGCTESLDAAIPLLKTLL